MSSDLLRIHAKLVKAIDANFKKPIEIECVVGKIYHQENYFTIINDDQSIMMECHVKEKIELQENDNIILQGWIKVRPNNTPSIYMEVDYYYPVSNSKKYVESIELYHRLLKTLHGSQYKPIIDKIKSTPPPKIINNIALISMRNDRDNINVFKDLFSKMCCGKLHMFHLDEKNIEKSLRAGIEYFKKYHNIHMICFLANKLSFAQSLDLSSKDNVKYLFNRKNFPYITSIDAPVLPSHEAISIIPLTNILSNKSFTGITSCIDFIHETQQALKMTIQKGIDMGNNILQNIMEHNRKKLFDLQMCMTEMNDIRFNTGSSSTESSFDKLKQLLLRRITKERFLLYNIYMKTMKSMVDDPRIKYLIDQIISREPTVLNELNSTTTTQNPDLRLKQIALSQNSHFQHHPSQINPSIKLQNTLISSMNANSLGTISSQKIENKRADNTLDDMVSINIQRNNGDF